MDLVRDLREYSPGEDVSAKDRLADLQAANLPRLTTDDLFHISGEEDKISCFTSNVDEYLADFVKTDNGRCICCGASIGGVFGSFTYGYAHGEGFCSKCSYPCRANHYIKDDNGKEILKFEAILQYHPSGLSIKV